ncbi:hypothetical protein PIB30_083728 [Stylosanthes scabra]|uniref:Uncharacterized protein n=1 Tax=Stylosanthes scabra TaxID=79078 RepID=A0ABU6SUI8_9FABA|nr:hypothetical protein [Stylosanthes scabra]
MSLVSLRFIPDGAKLNKASNPSPKRQKEQKVEARYSNSPKKIRWSQPGIPKNFDVAAKTHFPVQTLFNNVSPSKILRLPHEGILPDSAIRAVP